MDTWSVAQMLLDAGFALTIVSIVAGLLYSSEMKIYTRLTEMLSRPADPVVAPRTAVAESPLPSAVTVTEAAPVRTRAPRNTTTPRAARPVRKAGAVSASRAEKYLEAVRMYRQGDDKSTIEKALGISFMELELLGRVK